MNSKKNRPNTTQANAARIAEHKQQRDQMRRILEVLRADAYETATQLEIPFPTSQEAPKPE